ncbi:ATP-binding protein [Burkholderia gladioli]|uniref:ATP-binding protein n=1 Tax=Burkholderia gladioli TaxID=28095 RepID=UPI0009BC5453|nr:ATP-binding protein [Burkholderia gladioli]KAF1058558.1 Vitamin B12 import ATP-binding protein BtuD [Burkholderia gladioli]WAG22733.1 ATP-binding protein [Burkholderia gladioli]
MKITVNSSHKSIPRGLSFELPDFAIFTGKNGSGKSHLLEVMANPSLSNIAIEGKVAQKITLIGFNGLNPQVDEQCDSNQIISNVNNWWNQINGIVQQYNNALKNGEQFSDPLAQFMPRVANNPALQSVMSLILKRSGKHLEELNQDDVSENIRFTDIPQGNLFITQCALIFKSYHTRKVKNDFNKYRSDTLKINGINFLSDEEFYQKYGPPPWILVNDILARANLTYRVTSPEVGDFELPYRLRLVDKTTDTNISVNDLSSGEKVLMSLALAIYNTQESDGRPDLLLLDEPDAPLHPEFSKLLIETLMDTLVKKAGVKVVMTTHSPSTVAMAPDSCVFEVNRSTKIPELVGNAQATQNLTSGIDFLRVSFEKRRQVFVESKYDAQYFSQLYNILHRRRNFKFEPVFLEPHSGTSNCTDVIQIVNRLRSSGSDLAFGIIDFDSTNTSTDSIFVLGEGARYAIENYLLDPIYICLALIRNNKKGFFDFGVAGNKYAYTDSINLTQQECQKMVDAILTLLSIPLSNLKSVKLENGYELQYPEAYLLHQGHDYENKLLQAIPELNAIARGQGDSALKLGILQVIGEFPQFFPAEVADTLARVLNPIATRPAGQTSGALDTGGTNGLEVVV